MILSASIMLAIPYIINSVLCWDLQVVADIIFSVAKKESCKCINIIDIGLHAGFDVGLYATLQRLFSKLQLFSNVLELPLQNESCVAPLFVFLNALYFPMVSTNRSMSQPVFLIFDKSEVAVNDMFEATEISFDAIVIVAKLDALNEINLHSIYRVGPTYPLKVEEYFMSATTRQTNSRTSMNGLPLKVAISPQDMPSSWQNEDGTTDGFAVSIWRDLKSALNFSSVEIISNSSHGSLINGTWTGALGLLLDGTSDILLGGFNISPERLKDFDFLLTLHISRYQIYVKPQGHSFGYAAILAPLNPDVWAAIVGWIFFGGFCFFLVSRLSSRSCVLTETEWNRMGCVESILFILRTLSQQGTPEEPAVWSMRIVFVMAYLASAVLLPSYSASLISSLTRRSPAMPFNTIEELLNTNYYLYVHIGGADYNFFTTSQNEVYQEISKIKLKPKYHKNKDPPNYRILFKRFCENQDFAGLGNDLQVDFEWDLQKKGEPKSCELLKVEEKLSVVHHSWPIKKDSPYKAAFNGRILQFRECGILKRAYDAYWKNYVKPPKYFEEITLTDVSPVFIMYLVGTGMAVLLLFYERVSRRKFLIKSNTFTKRRWSF